MINESTKQAGQALQEAVYEELVKKSKLGQYAIIEKDGNPCRILASDILKESQNNKNDNISII